MKYLIAVICLCSFSGFSYGQLKSNTDSTVVLKLIREVLVWADSENSIDLLPVMHNDSIYTAFDLVAHKENLETLSKSNFFSKDFIAHYDQIIRHLDKKLRNNEFEYGTWYLGDMPPFTFAAEANPWCECQDNMDWNKIQIVQIDSQTYAWTWGELSPDLPPSWKSFKYIFKVVQEGNQLKISYMQGFILE